MAFCTFSIWFGSAPRSQHLSTAYRLSPAAAGTTGGISSVTTPDLDEDRVNAGPISALMISWRQSQPDAGKAGVIWVYRYYTGDADGSREEVCVGYVDPLSMEDTSRADSNAPLDLSVPTCPGDEKQLAPGRWARGHWCLSIIPMPLALPWCFGARSCTAHSVCHMDALPHTPCTLPLPTGTRFSSAFLITMAR